MPTIDWHIRVDVDSDWVNCWEAASRLGPIRQIRENHPDVVFGVAREQTHLDIAGRLCLLAQTDGQFHLVARISDGDFPELQTVTPTAFFVDQDWATNPFWSPTQESAQRSLLVPSTGGAVLPVDLQARPAHSPEGLYYRHSWPRSSSRDRLILVTTWALMHELQPIASLLTDLPGISFSVIRGATESWLVATHQGRWAVLGSVWGRGLLVVPVYSGTIHMGEMGSVESLYEAVAHRDLTNPTLATSQSIVLRLLYSGSGDETIAARSWFDLVCRQELQCLLPTSSAASWQFCVDRTYTPMHLTLITFDRPPDYAGDQIISILVGQLSTDIDHLPDHTTEWQRRRAVTPRPRPTFARGLGGLQRTAQRPKPEEQRVRQITLD